MLRRLLPVLLAIAPIAGCAGTASEGQESSRYRSNLGIATVIGVNEQTQRILVEKHHYVIQRSDMTGQWLYVETEWKRREPFADEKEIGVVDAQSRVILQGRPRIRHSSLTMRFNMKLIGENRLLYTDTGTWESGYISDMCEDYFRGIAREFKSEFSTMVREY